MTPVEQWPWYWMPVKDSPHYFKSVWLCLYDRVTAERSYPYVGVMAMNDFGDLVVVRP